MRRNLFAFYWLPVIAYAGFILAVSSIPGSAIRLPFSFFDKAAHIVEYGLLSLLLGRALRRASPWRESASSIRIAVIVVMIVVAFGAIDEIYQGTRGRDADLLDLAADAVGASLVQTLSVVLARESRGLSAS